MYLPIGTNSYAANEAVLRADKIKTRIERQVFNLCRAHDARYLHDVNLSKKKEKYHTEAFSRQPA